MKIRVLEVDRTKEYQQPMEALKDIGFSVIGKAVITTNDGHEVNDIYEKDGETIYILHVDNTSTFINSMTVCTLEAKSDYQLIGN
ncbi:hypothetical protein [Bacillus sp. FJAT-45350]|uniref:hypothetical protein n=1 Tax=Bacillus sp. FJAT-45350 TaxID=2011014 RepID=UPI000BB6C6DF|nr:hypothetical protein [Bacillus sp. FJAT-45350]